MCAAVAKRVAPLCHLIAHVGFLHDVHRMVQRQLADARAEADVLGQPGSLAHQHVRLGNGVRPHAVGLGDPGFAEAELVAQDDLVQVLLKRLRRHLMPAVARF